MRNIIFCVLAACLAAAPLAAAPRPVALDAIDHTAAELIVVGTDGAEATYDPATLERMPTYSLTTTTPWRSEPAVFEGVLLTDLLAAHGLSDIDAIEVTAENDYSVTIPRAVWEEFSILVATRVDGRAHSRRARGPIQFVIDMDAYSASANAREDYLVWMAARIEPAR